MQGISAQTLIKGGSVLLLALAWNDTIKKIVNVFMPIHDATDDLAIMKNAIVYMIAVTLLIIIVISAYNFVHTRTNSETYTRRQVNRKLRAIERSAGVL